MRLQGSLLQDYLNQAISRCPDQIALVGRKARWTYAELGLRSDAIAHELLSSQVSRGDRVILLAENSIEAIAAFWGILKADAVACVISPQTRPHKLAYYLRDTGACALIADCALALAALPVLKEASIHNRVILTGERHDGAPTSWATQAEFASWVPFDFRPPRRNIELDLATIIYTSGSTGEPKGVMLTHRNMVTASSAINHYLDNRESDIILSVLPLSFDYGLYQPILAAAVGARVVLERAFTLLPQVLARAAREEVTALPCVPSVIAFLDRVQVPPLPRLRYISSTGSALAEAHIETLRRKFPQAELFSMYGLTECKRCTYLPPRDLIRKAGSVGIAIPGIELWLVDENDKRLGPNEVGQLVVRGPTVMRGYWEKPDATARRLRPGPLPGESVLYTGDLCLLDDEGYLYFVSRMDEIIKSCGEKVVPHEVEQVLLNVKGVLEAAVISVPDSIRGHVVKAFVVVMQGISVDIPNLMDACRQCLEPVQVPREIEIVDSLPRTSNGKVDKGALLQFV